VIRAAKDLGDDVRKVSGIASKVTESITPEALSIIVGTIGMWIKILSHIKREQAIKELSNGLYIVGKEKILIVNK